DVEAKVPGLKFPPLQMFQTEDLCLGEYMAIAVETGDALALDALERVWRSSTRDGRKERRDWPTILQHLAAARSEVRQLMKAPAGDWNQPIGQRLKRAKLDSKITERLRNVSARDIAADLIGQEQHIKPGTVLSHWSNRAKTCRKRKKQSRKPRRVNNLQT